MVISRPLIQQVCLLIIIVPFPKSPPRSIIELCRDTVWSTASLTRGISMAREMTFKPSRYKNYDFYSCWWWPLHILPDWSKVKIVIVFWMGRTRPLFLYFRLLKTVDSYSVFLKKLLMTGFEPWTSGVESDHIDNWAIITAP